MFIGEQPGDQEDQAGHPFVGPSGAMLDRTLEKAGKADDAGACHAASSRGSASAHRPPESRAPPRATRATTQPGSSGSISAATASRAASKAPSGEATAAAAVITFRIRSAPI